MKSVSSWIRSETGGRFTFFYGYIVWAVATLGILATSPGQSFTVSLFIDHYIEDFQLGRTTVSGLYGLGTFLAALSLTHIGQLIDRYGNRRMVIVISILFAVVLGLLSLTAGPVTLLLGFIAIRMLGQGSLFLANSTLIAQWFWKRRGRMLSLTAVIYALFRSIYVPNLQRLLETMDWRQVWIVLGVAVGATLPALFWLFVRDRPEELDLLPDGAAPDEVTPAGQEQNTEDAHASEYVERNWTLRQAMRTSIFWVFAAGRVLVPGYTTGLVFHQVSIFESLGYDARTAAQVYGTMALITAATSILAGYLVDRIRPGIVLALQMFAMIMMLGTATIMTDRALLMVYALSYGFTMGTGVVFDGAVWTNLFGRKHQGAIRGFVTTAMVAGTSVGPFLFGLSFDFLGSYAPVFIFGMSLAVIVLLLSLIARPPHATLREQRVQ